MNVFFCNAVEKREQRYLFFFNKKGATKKNSKLNLEKRRCLKAKRKKPPSIEMGSRKVQTV